MNDIDFLLLISHFGCNELNRPLQPGEKWDVAKTLSYFDQAEDALRRIENGSLGGPPEPNLQAHLISSRLLFYSMRAATYSKGKQEDQALHWAARTSELYESGYWNRYALGDVIALSFIIMVRNKTIFLVPTFSFLFFSLTLIMWCGGFRFTLRIKRWI
jgi:hypothetical protein